MADGTGIEWTDATWNPVRGCSKVSAGCAHCYAETVAARFSGLDQPYAGLVDAKGKWNGTVRLIPEHLDDPLRWRKPRRIFVNSMSDLFHESLPDEAIDRVFGVMLACRYLDRGHSFQVLTKRAGRMRDYLAAEPSGLLRRWAVAVQALGWHWDNDYHFHDLIGMTTRRHWLPNGVADERFPERPEFGYADRFLPLSNVWLGVSVEDQRAADERIPLLLETPAAVRFLSCEPLLGPVSMRWLYVPPKWRETQRSLNEHEALRRLHWVIVGGESGHGARPMDALWARTLRDQCLAAGVAFFFKQWGEWMPSATDPDERNVRVGKKTAGRVLDGHTWDQFPAVTQ